MLTINNDNKSSFLLTYRPCWTLWLRKHFPQQPLPRATLDVIESARAHARLCSALCFVSCVAQMLQHSPRAVWPRDSSVRESFIRLRWKYINCYVVTQVGAWEAVEAKWQRCGIIGIELNCFHTWSAHELHGGSFSNPIIQLLSTFTQHWAGVISASAEQICEKAKE